MLEYAYFDGMYQSIYYYCVLFFESPKVDFWEIYTYVFILKNHDKFWRCRRLQVYLYLYQSC